MDFQLLRFDSPMVFLAKSNFKPLATSCPTFQLCSNRTWIDMDRLPAIMDAKIRRVVYLLTISYHFSTSIHLVAYFPIFIHSLSSFDLFDSSLAQPLPAGAMFSPRKRRWMPWQAPAAQWFPATPSRTTRWWSTTPLRERCPAEFLFQLDQY